MQATKDELRRRYQALETAELLMLFWRGDLTESASAVLQDILASRGTGTDAFTEQIEPDFATFLREAMAKETDGGNVPHHLFPDPLFSAEGGAVSDADLEALEERIGAVLPASYKVFLKVHGPGFWCGEGVLAPNEVWVLDDSAWEMKGFVCIVSATATGVGDYLAFNPADPERGGEKPIYYCGHDPFGYARIAQSFESWARSILVSTLKSEDFYEKVGDAIYEKWKEYEAAQPRRWWQFWR